MMQIRFVRHAHTNRDVELDRERPLTEAGERAATSLGGRWRAERFEPDIVVCSTAQRARHTALLVCPPSTVRVLQEEFYFGTDPSWGPPIEAAFHEYGNAPLERYLTSPARDALVRYGDAACATIVTLAKQRSPIRRMAVFGHAVFLPAIALRLLLTRGEPAPERPEILKQPLEECGVIDLRLTSL